ncbi:MAG: Mov34/MPN/PAD-1 family protein [Hyphomicrobium sp.]
MFVLTDGVEREIVSRVGEPAPEEGGALLGPRLSNLISQFIYDEQAERTSVSYTPSKSLRDAVRRAERERGLVFKGIVHSHPSGFDQLSGGDLQTIAKFFDANPALASFYCPIINRTAKSASKAPHVLDLGNGISLTSYEVWRRDKRPGFERGYHLQPLVDVRKVRTTVMPVDAAAQEVAAGLEAAWNIAEIETGHIQLSGQHYEVRIIAGSGSELQLLFPAGFPATKPTALFTRNTGSEKRETIELLFPWRLCGSGVSELANAILPLIPEPVSPRSNPQTSSTRSEDHDPEARSEQAA